MTDVKKQLSDAVISGVAQVTMQNGTVYEGQIYSTESATPFCPGGLTVLKRQADSGHSSYSIIVGDSVEKFQIQDQQNGAGSHLVQTLTAPSQTTAATRESDAASLFYLDKQNIGAAVTKPAQTLYNKFSKQFPKDTRWHRPGETQDIVVLGVRVKYPFSADNCEVEVPDGVKSLERISNMVTNFLNSEASK
eukprot:Protomagalhaensia_wolfi_Nauph_80__6339@NODE_990_length_1825_cov_204_889698_g747_i0_p2_GENE_NODE_990_length_1825_cov_204_889698_g747_i0NODE_990_length_1825_cov_204_889698_g747_i0_p2_ORF_typecomplete_len192_score16_18AD/PF09793_9/1_2e11Gemin6/PF06372_12/0_00085_NODE_990_length_1825_cov_204_889698_g747_i011861761